MNLCLRAPEGRAPAGFYFSSSISARQGSPDAECVEDYASTPAAAGGTGYARSKWVVEKLCERAALETPLRVGVLRIGQMVGDTIQ
jgi:thioester reductase-like protein